MISRLGERFGVLTVLKGRQGAARRLTHSRTRRGAAC